MSKTVEYILSSPISYQYEGSATEGEIIYLTAPSAKNHKKIAKLKQGFMRAISDLDDSKQQENKVAEEDVSDREKGLAMLGLLQMSKTTDYDDYIELFISLLSDGLAKIDDKVVLTNLLVEKLSFSDIEGLLSDYLVNFIIGSAT